VIPLTVFVDAPSRRHNDVTSFSVYLAVTICAVSITIAAT